MDQIVRDELRKYAGTRQGRTARIATSLVPLAHASLRIE